MGRPPTTLQRKRAKLPCSRWMARKARAFATALSILPRWRMIPGSRRRRVTTAGVKRATRFGSKPAKARRYPLRLRSTVDQLSPACAPSREEPKRRGRVGAERPTRGRDRRSSRARRGPSGSGVASGSAAVSVDGGADVIRGAAQGGCGRSRYHLLRAGTAQPGLGHGRASGMRVRADRVVVTGDRRARGRGRGREAGRTRVGARGMAGALGGRVGLVGPRLGARQHARMPRTPPPTQCIAWRQVLWSQRACSRR